MSSAVDEQTSLHIFGWQALLIAPHSNDRKPQGMYDNASKHQLCRKFA